MSESVWTYKYVFKTNYFRIAILKREDWAIKLKKEYKLPRIIIEYKINWIWQSIGLLR